MSPQSHPHVQTAAFSIAGEGIATEIVVAARMRLPLGPPAPGREFFQRLVQQWRDERGDGASSSIADIIACPSYLRIIGSGWQVLPFVIEQLKSEGDEPDHWCAALEAVTGENPVPEDAYGDTVGIARAWIEWYKDSRDQWYLSQSQMNFQVSLAPIAKSQVLRLSATTASPGPHNPT